jgi:glycine cleavage system H protein
LASPPDRRYTKEHEWVTDDGTIGITDYAQDQLGDIVFVDLPPVGTRVAYMQKFGEIESVKAVSELFSPVSGEITERNEALTDNPQWVNDSPYDEGWMLKVSLSNLGELENLMTADEYENFIQGPGS